MTYVDHYYQWVTGQSSMMPEWGLCCTFTPAQRMMRFLTEPSLANRVALETMNLTCETDLSGLYRAYRHGEIAHMPNIVLDVSGWDVSNITNMNDLFSYMPCRVVGFEHWDVRKVKSMDRMFSHSRVELSAHQLRQWSCASLVSAKDFAKGYNIASMLI